MKITTVQQLRNAIKRAKAIYVTPRFGACEREVKITRKEAMLFIADMDKGQTPEDFEMYASSFGEFDGEVLSLG